MGPCLVRKNGDVSLEDQLQMMPSVIPTEMVTWLTGNLDARRRNHESQAIKRLIKEKASKMVKEQINGLIVVRIVNDLMTGITILTDILSMNVAKKMLFSVQNVGGGFHTNKIAYTILNENIRLYVKQLINMLLQG